ncbi:MAG TPA: SCO family protein [Longimicrobiales bacterium]|nr:SCO family protein [Longimicrobiales bacterium]
MQRYRFVALVLMAVAATAAVVVSRLAPPSFHGTDLGPSSEPRDFTLQEADRGDVRLSDFRGRAVLLFFGYTSCPDICPITMSKLQRAMEWVGDRRRDARVILVTVDPTVDTPFRLRDYVQRFDPEFVGLGGERSELAEVARSFGAWAGEPERAPASPSGAHAGHATGPDVAADGSTGAAARLIPHTSHVFGLDRDGRLRILWGPELTAEQIAEDLRGLLRL